MGKEDDDQPEGNITPLTIDIHSPYYLHFSNGPGQCIVHTKYNLGDNFDSWRRVLTKSVIAKNKLGFIHGSIPRPNDKHQLVPLWERCNALVISWISNGLSTDLAQSIVYFDSACLAWNDLVQRFGQTSKARVFQLHQELANVVDMSKIFQADVDKYACGNLMGTLYGPAEGLPDEKKPFRHMNYEEYLNYEKKVNETQGFDVDSCTGCMPGRISQLSEGGYEWKVAEFVAKNAGCKQGDAMGIPIEFVRLVKANFQPVQGNLYYLTFHAITSDQMVKTYKAKVWCKPVTWECEIVLFLDVSEGKDITEKRKADKMVRGRGRTASAKKEHIKFNIKHHFPRPVKLHVNPTIQISAEQLQIDGCNLLAEKLKTEYPELTDAAAASTASSKWKHYRYTMKAPFLEEATKMFERQHPRLFPNTK